MTAAANNNQPREPWAHDLEALIETAQSIRSLGRAPTPEEAAALERTARGLGTNVSGLALPLLRPLKERAAAVGNSAPRLATGLPTLDRLTRGGFPPSKRLTLIGQPGACKTGMALALAERWARHGVHVGFLAADEDGDAILIRLGQAHGLAREALEAGDEGARRELAAIVECSYPTLLLADQDEDGWTLEDLAAELRRRAGDEPMVLVADSYQMLRLRGPERSLSRREQVDEVVRNAKRVSAGMLLVTTSEMNRGAYRSRNANENVTDIAAAAETRAIEYQATTLLALRVVPGGSDQGTTIDVTVPKNRLGPTSTKPALRVEWSFERATLREVAIPDETPTDGQLEHLADRALAALKRSAKPLSKSALAKKLGRRKDAVCEAVDLLEERGEVEFTSRGYQPVPSGSRTVPEPAAP